MLEVNQQHEMGALIKLKRLDKTLGLKVVYRKFHWHRSKNGIK